MNERPLLWSMDPNLSDQVGVGTPCFLGGRIGEERTGDMFIAGVWSGGSHRANFCELFACGSKPSSASLTPARHRSTLTMSSTREIANRDSYSPFDSDRVVVIEHTNEQGDTTTSKGIGPDEESARQAAFAGLAKR